LQKTRLIGAFLPIKPIKGLIRQFPNLPQRIAGWDRLLDRDVGEEGAAVRRMSSHLRWADAPFSQTPVVFQRTPKAQTPDTRPSPGARSPQEQAFSVLGEIIADAVRSVSVVPPVSPLQVHRDLAEAADGGFLLTSRQVASILGISNSTTHGWNSEEERMGFVMKRQGVGRWPVLRPTGIPRSVA